MQNKYVKWGLWLAVIGGTYALFAQPHDASVDDVRYVELAQDIGVQSLLYKNNDSYYPLCRVAALLGFPGLQVIAFLSLLLFGWYALRVGGYWFSLVATVGVAGLLGIVRSPFASSVGMATHGHFLFLLSFILLIAFPKMLRTSDAWVAGGLSFVSGLPGVMAPLFLVGRPSRVRTFVFVGAAAGLALHLGVKQLLPSDVALVVGQDQTMLTRAVSFDVWLWLSVVGTQGFTSLFPGKEIGSVMAQVYHQFPDILIAFGALSSGWLFITLCAGWKYFVATVWASICCFVFSVPTYKWHLLPYPNHGHYLHWVCAAVFIAVLYRVMRKN